MENFICIMEDGSEFRMPCPEWDKALSMKYPVEEWEKIKELFKKQVAKHWKEKTVPTKFSFDEHYETEYENQAELGRDVMYQYIRVPLMGIALAEATGGKSKVVALSDKDVTIYSDKEPEKMSMDKFLEEVKDE